mgnify:FL=1
METRQIKPGTVILLALLLLIGVVSVKTIDVASDIREAKEQEEAISLQLQQMQQANASLKQDLSRADDEEFIRELARDLLNMAEPGERIFYDVHN